MVQPEGRRSTRLVSVKDPLDPKRRSGALRVLKHSGLPSQGSGHGWVRTTGVRGSRTTNGTPHNRECISRVRNERNREVNGIGTYRTPRRSLSKSRRRDFESCLEPRSTLPLSVNDSLIPQETGGRPEVQTGRTTHYNPSTHPYHPLSPVHLGAEVFRGRRKSRESERRDL